MKILLGEGRAVVLDVKGYVRIGHTRWRYYKHPKNRTGYAVTDKYDETGKKIGQIYMHRVVASVDDPKIKVDHRNHDGLDNREENLRVCSHAGNMRNRKLSDNSASGFKGVSLYRDGRFRARIQIDGKGVHLGYFVEATDAARAYDEHAIRFFGEFALTNKQMGLLP